MTLEAVQDSFILNIIVTFTHWTMQTQMCCVKQIETLDLGNP